MSRSYYYRGLPGFLQFGAAMGAGALGWICQRAQSVLGRRTAINQSALPR